MATVTTVVSELDEIEVLAAREKENLVETDGEPLETPWHRAEINLLIDSVSCHRRGLKNFYVGGNMFIYYSRRQSRERNYRGPDFFFVQGVDGTRERQYWWVFEEDGKYPDVIIELLSSSTAEIDRTVKKDLYEQTFRTPEYFCYDPDTQKLEGWRLNSELRYHALTPNERGWLWSEQLGLWIGSAEGIYLQQRAVWLRFFTPEGKLVLTEAEREHRRVGDERQRAEEERQRAEEERQRAEAEHHRAEALAAEVSRLQALLKEKGITPETDT
jgi:Uma2 family endonuclease